VFTPHSSLRPARIIVGTACAVTVGVLFATASSASAAQAPIDLGSATSFAVLAGSTVTNTGPSVVSGDLGVSPGSAITGFRPPPTEPGLVINGSIHAADPVADLAQTDETTAYTDAAGASPVTNVATELGGSTLVGGVYASATLGLTGTLTLSGDASSVWIFQAGSSLITSTASRVVLTGGASACNVFWQIGSSATLGTGSAFVGTVLAHTAITADTGATVEGRLFAQTAAVTLDTNTITGPTCTTTGVGSSPASTTPASSTPASSTPSNPGSSAASTTPASGGSSGSSVTPSAPGAGTNTHTPASSSSPSTARPHRHPSQRSATAGQSTSGLTHQHATSSGPSNPVSSTTPVTLTDTTTSLSRTGGNIETPIVYGLLALLGGITILFTARRKAVIARHRR
jgi:hypothetical protein